MPRWREIRASIGHIKQKRKKIIHDGRAKDENNLTCTGRRENYGVGYYVSCQPKGAGRNFEPHRYNSLSLEYQQGLFNHLCQYCGLAHQDGIKEPR